MGDGILGTAFVLIILVVIVIFAIKSCLKNKCGGDCSSCGGSCSSVGGKGGKKNLQNAIAGKKIVSIEGMQCGHCKDSVESAVNKIDGAACMADPDKNQAIVFMSKEISDEEIKSAIESVGFKVKGIKREF